jgi:hypothetical protein
MDRVEAFSESFSDKAFDFNGVFLSDRRSAKGRVCGQVKKVIPGLFEFITAQ